MRDILNINDKERLGVSAAAALLLHLLFFVILHAVPDATRSRFPEYSGPLTVTITPPVSLQAPAAARERPEETREVRPEPEPVREPVVRETERTGQVERSDDAPTPRPEVSAPSGPQERTTQSSRDDTVSAERAAESTTSSTGRSTSTTRTARSDSTSSNETVSEAERFAQMYRFDSAGTDSSRPDDTVRAESIPLPSGGTASSQETTDSSSAPAMSDNELLRIDPRDLGRSSEQSTDTPSYGSPTTSRTAEGVPDDTTSKPEVWSSGSRIIYGDETSSTPTSPDEPSTGSTSSGSRTADDGSIIDSDVLDSLDRALDSSGSGSDGSGQSSQPSSRQAMVAREETRSVEIGTPEANTDDPFEIEFESTGANRSLLSWVKPDLAGELFRDLPPKITVNVNGTLSPSGYLTRLEIDPPIGYSEVETAVVTAMRSWKFESLKSGTGSEVQVTIRYDIVVR